ncbi:Uncharacterised protein [BD1-7 clade bacterium]|uniref:Pilus assembly protein CpaD n=1 Tax=BD1-7 clade bacterium TaxID=2029982 RepID=A0A5S9Q9H7_9GAMM|nr:Uncharacterised protein [BD1-7 clade bacterium]CAA0114034.1 Uncharacterised protein [BD1-7 clade bacterium]
MGSFTSLGYVCRVLALTAGMIGVVAPALAIDTSGHLSVKAKMIQTSLPLSRTGVNSQTADALQQLFKQKQITPEQLSAVVTLAPSDARLLTKIQQALVSLGIRSDLIQVQLNAEQTPKTAALALEYYVATVDSCDTGHNNEFGCSSTNNLAAMVADPRHLVQPEALTAAMGDAAVHAIKRAARSPNARALDQSGSSDDVSIRLTGDN